jgi:hypothetical protein
VTAIERYLSDAYGARGWDTFDYDWHATESAAFKREVRLIDAYTDRKGELPPWNARRGGGGGQSYFACRAGRSDGSPCRNLALDGNYGFCGVHR